jgi:hypothetical protein
MVCAGSLWPLPLHKYSEQTFMTQPRYLGWWQGTQRNFHTQKRIRRSWDPPSWLPTAPGMGLRWDPSYYLGNRGPGSAQAVRKWAILALRVFYKLREWGPLIAKVIAAFRIRGRSSHGFSVWRAQQFLPDPCGGMCCTLFSLGTLMRSNYFLCPIILMSRNVKFSNSKAG